MNEKISNQWIMLMYQLPTKPSNIRVRVWRRLQKLGAIGLCNSAYLLPNQKSYTEDFEWLKKEIIDVGGEASVFSANSINDLDNNAIEKMFRDARDHEYKSILELCENLFNELDNDVKETHISPDRIVKYEVKLKKILSDFDEVKMIDFFSATLCSNVEQEIEKIKSHISKVAGFEQKDSDQTRENMIDIKSLKNKTWVTRKHLHIDRTASGWLIKRFIDSEAKFDFVNENEYVLKENYIPFDIHGAEFGHHGEYCTFETFIQRLGLDNDHALIEIGEIVHDIDLKDEKFGRMEARGIDRVITGLGDLCEDDPKLLELTEKVFDGLYKRMRR